jgi:predicted DNA binding CopG/RHH family protein
MIRRQSNSSGEEQELANEFASRTRRKDRTGKEHIILFGSTVSTKHRTKTVMLTEPLLLAVVEKNSQGGIPYVPFLRAPWYFWIGRKGISQNGQQE